MNPPSLPSALSRRACLKALGTLTGAAALTSLGNTAAVAATSRQALPWSRWMPIDGVAKGGIGAACTPGETVSVAVVTNDGTSIAFRRLASSPQGPMWLPWQDAEARIVGSPALTTWGAGRLDFAVLGSDSSIYHRTWIAGQNWPVPWLKRTDKSFASSPTMCTWGHDRLDIFAHDHNNELHQMTWNAGWSPQWINHGGSHVGQPASAALVGHPRIDLATLSPRNTIQHKFFDGTTWSPWIDIGGQLTGSPSLARRDHNTLDLFTTGYSPTTGRNDAVIHRTYSNGAWGPWNDLGGSTPYPPTACAWGSMGLAVFIVQADGNITHRAFG